MDDQPYASIIIEYILHEWDESDVEYKSQATTEILKDALTERLIYRCDGFPRFERSPDFTNSRLLVFVFLSCFFNVNNKIKKLSRI